MAKVEITPEFIRAAAQHPDVRRQLRRLADKAKTRADQLAANEGVEMETWVEESVRPKGRPQAVLYGDNTEQEWGSSRTDRRRIIGRSGEGL